MKQRITIIGAGLVGSLMSIFLGKRGHTVDVFEKLPDIRKHRIDAGRSINLALANRGIRPLKKVGIMDKVEQLLIPMSGRMLHDLDGQLQYQSYGQRDHEVIYSVSRGGLVSLLRDEAEATGSVTFHFEHSLESIDHDKKTLIITDKNNNNHAFTHDFDILLAADGAGSRVRRSLEALGVLDCRSELLDHSYKELTIPASESGGFLIDKNALHIWPRGQYMLIALPNLDGSFTVTLFLPTEGQLSFASLHSDQAVQKLFNDQFSDVINLIPDLSKMFFENPTGILGTIRCQQWHYKSSLLIGDSAHAIVPFHGQGMNCGFEDCFELDRLLDEYNDDWHKVMDLFTEVRKDNANAIADMALDNYIEMRDSVRDPKFHLKKAIAFELERSHPNRFIPRYSMVSFSHIPYAQAQQRGAVQAQILTELTQGIDDIKDFDRNRADQLIKQRLERL